MSNGPKIVMILSDQPLPTPRDRQIAWLQFCFATLADIPMENVSVVHADDQEAVTVHLTCTCVHRHMRTLTHWCGSDDDFYTFTSSDGMMIRLPFEPTFGDE